MGRGLLAATSFCTLLFLGFISFRLWDSYRHLRTTQQAQFELRGLTGTITHLDEVLTMSARMSAATGDPAWEARYRRFDPLLDEAIKRVMAKAQESRLRQAVAQTDEANAKLVAMELQAFECVHEDRRAMAMSILSSPEYEAQKERYRQGLELITNSIASELQAAVEDQQRVSFLAILAMSILGPALIAAWLGIAWLVRRHLRDHTQAEEALRQSNARLDFALQAGRMGVWDLDLATLEAHGTRTTDRIFGYEASAPDWTYDLFLKQVLPEDRPEVERSLQEALVSQGDWAFECRILRADGVLRHIMGTGSHAKNGAGKPLRMQGLIADITERKQAEDEREAHMKVLAEALAEVRRLKDFLPICAYCRKIRNDKNYWSQMEDYITEQTGSQFSHGICPECAEKHFGHGMSPPNPRP